MRAAWARKVISRFFRLSMQTIRRRRQSFKAVVGAANVQVEKEKGSSALGLPLMADKEIVFDRLTTILKSESGFALENKGGRLLMYTYVGRERRTFFERSAEDTEDAMWRRELRSLVIAAKTGEVAARALPKFRFPGESKSGRKLIVAEATIKLDGVMLFGVRNGSMGAMELWTKGGHTEIAKRAEDFAALGSQDERGARYEDLLKHSDEKGLTLSFEYEGRHHAFGRVGSIAGAVDKLTLVAARDKISGRFLTHSELLRFGEVYGVPVVERKKELEGKSLAEVMKVIRREEGVEGVVAAVVGSGHGGKLNFVSFRRGGRGRVFPRT